MAKQPRDETLAQQRRELDGMLDPAFWPTEGSNADSPIPPGLLIPPDGKSWRWEIRLRERDPILSECSFATKPEAIQHARERLQKERANLKAPARTGSPDDVNEGDFN